MPGLTDTDMNPATSEYAAQARNQAALGRYAEPREIADFVAYWRARVRATSPARAWWWTAATPPEAYCS
jgi:NAD(P)-dependent dehydrogenase (short-subunit alcohol dehydrogenase family)